MAHFVNLCEIKSEYKLSIAFANSHIFCVGKNKFNFNS